MPTLIAKKSWDWLKPDIPYDKLPVLEVEEPDTENGKNAKKTTIESPLKIANYIADKYGLVGRNDKARAEVIVKECLDFITTGTEDQKMETNFYKAGRLLV